MAHPVEVVPYDPMWPARFAGLRGRIAAVLASLPPQAIEHVGSTAVPGLWARPDVDVDVRLAPRSGPAGVIAALAAAGYRDQGDLGVAGRHAVEAGCHVRVRDRLREEPEVRDACAGLKRALARAHPCGGEAYTAGKPAPVAGVLADGGAARGIGSWAGSHRTFTAL